MPRSMILRDQLRAWLRAHGRKSTAAQLAEHLGLPVRSVENWLQGRPCNATVAERIILPKLSQTQE